METQGNIITVAICSPGDLIEERQAIPKLFVKWNAANKGVFLQPKMWESSSVPEMGDHPQHILNNQLLVDSDLLVAMFWSKLGTPTPTEKSGTIEEIREFVKLKGPKRALVYFCDRPLPHGPSSIDPTELAKLIDFKDEIKSQGLYSQFNSLQELENELYRHLDIKVQQLLANELLLPEDTKNIPAQENEAPLPADRRLHHPIEFGTTIKDIAENFKNKMDEFDSLPMGIDKFLNLGAHTYNSVALCLDRFLVFSAHGMASQDRNVFERCFLRLKKLAAEHKTYSQRIPAFWEKGREISDELIVHQSFMVQMRRQREE